MSSLMAPLIERLNAVRGKCDVIKHEPDFKPLCLVKVNGVKVHALVDSGNLVSIAISDTFAKELLGVKLGPYLSPVTDTVRTCKRGKSGKIEVLGRVKSPMLLDFGQDLIFKIRPIVIKDFSSRMNISGKFLAHWKIDQLHSIGCLKINDKLVKMLQYIPKSWQHEENSALAKENICSVDLKMTKKLHCHLEKPLKMATPVAAEAKIVTKRVIQPQMTAKEVECPQGKIPKMQREVKQTANVNKSLANFG